MSRRDGPGELERWTSNNGFRTPDLRGAVPEQAVGEPMGRYLEIEVLGRGGGGEVLAVWDSVLRRVVAAKVQMGMDDREAEVLIREARIGGQLSHPNIIPIHEAGRDERGRMYFTMRRIDGSSLRDLLYGEGSDDTLPDGPTTGDPLVGVRLVKLLSVFTKLCDAVAYSHSKGVIHRDLKPHNVMIGTFGEVWLVDWGLCWLTDDPGRTWTPREAGKGTPAWMPPEALQPGAPEPGPRTDIYALGAILYAILCGRPPWRGSSALVIREKRANDPPPPSAVVPGVPWELEAVVLKAMSRDPADRYASVVELREDIEAFLEGRVLQAPEYGLLEPVRRWVRRHRVAVGVAIAGLLALGVVGAVGVVRLRAEKQVSEANLAGFRRLADLQLLDQAVAAEQDLWPAHPDLLEPMDAWLAGVEPLVARLDDHIRAANQLQHATPSGLDPAEVAWLQGQLGILVERLGVFASPAGAVQRVRDRRARAATLQARSLDDHREAWAHALDAIAVHDAYGGLRMRAVLGLVPLGPDPDSGLWAFGDLESGTLPVPDTDGRWPVAEEHGVVYVLVPGGPTRVLDGSGATTTVTLDPFLVARHELTQAQWLRITAKNPSHNAAGTSGVTALNPVEYVSWGEATEAARRVAATLPTEAQWEHAARAGTATAWFTGDDPSELVRVANLEGEADGYALHAPVGSFAPNPWGLFDVHGNVYEWTLDTWGTGALTHGTGLRETGEGTHRAIRGGGYTLGPDSARSDARIRTGSETRFRALGLRLVRRVEVVRDE